MKQIKLNYLNQQSPGMHVSGFDLHTYWHITDEHISVNQYCNNISQVLKIGWIVCCSKSKLFYFCHMLVLLIKLHFLSKQFCNSFVTANLEHKELQRISHLFMQLMPTSSPPIITRHKSTISQLDISTFSSPQAQIHISVVFLTAA